MAKGKQMTEQAKSTPKATGASKPMGLLQAKWVLVGQALSTPKLSAGDCAVLWQLCERYNEQAGAAWPSMTRLASDISRDRKTVQRSLAKLEAAKLVQVTERGTRTRSNRYKPIFPKVGAQAPEGRGVDAPQVGAHTPLEPIHEPGHKAGVNGGGPSPANAGSGGGAGVALGAPPVPPSGRQYSAFWSAYPKATGVFKAEQVIESILASGEATLADLVNGARTYAAWVQAQPWSDKSKYTKGPGNWLTERRWLDDWTITKKQAPHERGEQIRQAESRKEPNAAEVKKLKTRIRQIQAPSSGLCPVSQEAFINALGQVLGSQTVRHWLERRQLGQGRHPQPQVTPEQLQQLVVIIKEYGQRARVELKASKGAAK